jgi:hypothetical protein
MKEKSKQRKISRINKLLNAYLDNPEARNARKLLARQVYILHKPEARKRTTPNKRKVL